MLTNCSNGFASFIRYFLILAVFVGFTLQAKLVSSKYLIQVHLKISSRTLENLALHLKHKLSIIVRGKIRNAIARGKIMEPLQRKNVLSCLLFILSLILTRRVLTLQEMHRYFIVYEYLATKQKNIF